MPPQRILEFDSVVNSIHPFSLILRAFISQTILSRTFIRRSEGPLRFSAESRRAYGTWISYTISAIVCALSPGFMRSGL